MKQRVLLIGRDAVDLLNRISTVDPDRLREHVGKGLILNASGKILSYFELQEKDGHLLEVVCTDHFLTLLDQFTFAERYEKNVSPLTPEHTRESTHSTEEERILNLIPALGKEFSENGETNPLEVNLRDAIHDQKGCYPGQEVIEKIISLGSPPRRLVLLSVDSPIDLSDSSRDSFSAFASTQLPVPLLNETCTSDVGVLTSFSGRHALGIVKRTHLQLGQIFKISAHPNYSFQLKQVAP